MMPPGAYSSYAPGPPGEEITPYQPPQQEPMQEEEDEEEVNQKLANSLPIWGNEKTMNLNTLLLTNIQSSQYFKVKLYALKTYHEVIDEIYHQVGHLEPWEKGSRKTAGQTGMCGGVRGVGAGGIVSTAYCILYKLFTLRLTRKQLNGLLNNCDSPYIRGLGFMYIRYTQPPADLWDWYEPYMDDEEEIDVRAGGGQMSTIGAMVRQFLTKLDWHATLFPRIPVPIQKQIEKKINERDEYYKEEERRERMQHRETEEVNRRSNSVKNGRSKSRDTDRRHDRRDDREDRRDDRRDEREDRDSRRDDRRDDRKDSRRDDRKDYRRDDRRDVRKDDRRGGDRRDDRREDKYRRDRDTRRSRERDDRRDRSSRDKGRHDRHRSRSRSRDRRNRK